MTYVPTTPNGAHKSTIPGWAGGTHKRCLLWLLYSERARADSEGGLELTRPPTCAHYISQVRYTTWGSRTHPYPLPWGGRVTMGHRWTRYPKKCCKGMYHCENASVRRRRFVLPPHLSDSRFYSKNARGPLTPHLRTRCPGQG